MNNNITFKYRRVIKAGVMGFSLIELLIVVIILVMLITLLLTTLELRSRTVVKSVAVMFRSNFDACRKIAALSPKGKVAIVFRPTDGPYTTYYVSSDIQKEKRFTLPIGVKLINTNGLIQNHMIRIGINGEIIDEFGDPRKYPNPGILTFTSVETDRVFELKIDIASGVMELE